MTVMQNNRRSIILRANATMTVAIIAAIAILASGAYAIGATNGQKHEAKIASVTPPLPMPQLPPIGASFPELTPKGQIVTVQAPPMGKGEAANKGHWITGTPEQVAAITPNLAENRFHRPELVFPPTGTIQWYDHASFMGGQYADLTFADQLADGQAKLVRIRSEDGKTVADVYLNGGESRLALPLGRYRLGLAVGRRWEGPETLFGPYGTYYEIDAMELSEPAEKTRYTRIIGLSAPDATAQGTGQQ